MKRIAGGWRRPGWWLLLLLQAGCGAAAPAGARHLLVAVGEAPPASPREAPSGGADIEPVDLRAPLGARRPEPGTGDELPGPPTPPAQPHAGGPGPLGDRPPEPRPAQLPPSPAPAAAPRRAGEPAGGPDPLPAPRPLPGPFEGAEELTADALVEQVLARNPSLPQMVAA